MPKKILPAAGLSFRVGLLVMGTLAFSASAPAAVDPAIPSYQPQPVSPPKSAGYLLPDGSLQIVSYQEMKGVVAALDELFLKSHPGFKFQLGTANDLGAIACLTFDASAFAPLSWEVAGGLAYNAYAHGEPFGIKIAHASLNPSAAVSPLSVIVHPSNPIARLNADQVSRMFTEGGRKLDLDHWNQLGLKGDWAEREIHPGGLPWTDQYRSADSGYPDLFAHIMGGNQPAWNYEAKPNYADIVKKVSEDPSAIGLVALNQVTDRVKVVPVGINQWAKAYRGSAEDIVSGKYPYDRFLYIFVRRASGKSVEPFITEYLRMVLSREGQEAIAAESHGYLPLNANEAKTELAKLD